MTGRARAYKDQGLGSQLCRRRFLEPGFSRQNALYSADAQQRYPPLAAG